MLNLGLRQEIFMNYLEDYIMEYKIKDVTKITGLSASALRFYENRGLLPKVKRNEAGVRIYTEKDLDLISLITCYKDTEMPINEIKKFIALCMEGNATLEQRHQIVLAHQKAVRNKIENLKCHLEHIDFKVVYYDTACKIGSEEELKTIPYIEGDQDCIKNIKFFLKKDDI